MSHDIGATCVEVLARAYYGLDLIGSATYYKKAARKNSIKSSLKSQLITPDHRITEQGLWKLRRAMQKQ